jgi:hypothetical protein
MGLSTVDGVRANAASWNAPFMAEINLALSDLKTLDND